MANPRLQAFLQSQHGEGKLPASSLNADLVHQLFTQPTRMTLKTFVPIYDGFQVSSIVLYMDAVYQPLYNELTIRSARQDLLSSPRSSSRDEAMDLILGWVEADERWPSAGQKSEPVRQITAMLHSLTGVRTLIHTSLCRCATRQIVLGRAQAAADLTKAAIRAEERAGAPDNVNMVLLMGLAQVGLGDWVAAESSFRRVIARINDATCPPTSMEVAVLAQRCLAASILAQDHFSTKPSDEPWALVNSALAAAQTIEGYPAMRIRELRSDIRLLKVRSADGRDKAGALQLRRWVHESMDVGAGPRVAWRVAQDEIVSLLTKAGHAAAAIQLARGSLPLTESDLTNATKASRRDTDAGMDKFRHARSLMLLAFNLHKTGSASVGSKLALRCLRTVSRQDKGQDTAALLVRWCEHTWGNMSPSTSAKLLSDVFDALHVQGGDELGDKANCEHVAAAVARTHEGRLGNPAYARPYWGFLARRAAAAIPASDSSSRSRRDLLAARLGVFRCDWQRGDRAAGLAAATAAMHEAERLSSSSSSADADEGRCRDALFWQGRAADVVCRHDGPAAAHAACVALATAYFVRVLTQERGRDALAAVPAWRLDVDRAYCHLWRMMKLHFEAAQQQQQGAEVQGVVVAKQVAAAGSAALRAIDEHSEAGTPGLGPGDVLDLYYIRARTAATMAATCVAGGYMASAAANWQLLLTKAAPGQRDGDCDRGGYGPQQRRRKMLVEARSCMWIDWADMARAGLAAATEEQQREQAQRAQREEALRRHNKSKEQQPQVWSRPTLSKHAMRVKAAAERFARLNVTSDELERAAEEMEAVAAETQAAKTPTAEAEADAEDQTAEKLFEENLVLFINNPHFINAALRRIRCPADDEDAVVLKEPTEQERLLFIVLCKMHSYHQVAREQIAEKQPASAQGEEEEVQGPDVMMTGSGDAGLERATIERLFVAAAEVAQEREAAAAAQKTEAQAQAPQETHQQASTDVVGGEDVKRASETKKLHVGFAEHEANPAPEAVLPTPSTAAVPVVVAKQHSQVPPVVVNGSKRSLLFPNRPRPYLRNLIPEMQREYERLTLKRLASLSSEVRTADEERDEVKAKKDENDKLAAPRPEKMLLPMRPAAPAPPAIANGSNFFLVAKRSVLPTPLVVVNGSKHRDLFPNSSSKSDNKAKKDEPHLQPHPLPHRFAPAPPPPQTQAYELSASPVPSCSVRAHAELPIHPKPTALTVVTERLATKRTRAVRVLERAEQQKEQGPSKCPRSSGSGPSRVAPAPAPASKEAPVRKEPAFFFKVERPPLTAYEALVYRSRGRGPVAMPPAPANDEAFFQPGNGAWFEGLRRSLDGGPSQLAGGLAGGSGGAASAASRGEEASSSTGATKASDAKTEEEKAEAGADGVPQEQGDDWSVLSECGADTDTDADADVDTDANEADADADADADEADAEADADADADDDADYDTCNSESSSWHMTDSDSDEGQQEPEGQQDTTGGELVSPVSPGELEIVEDFFKPSST